MHGDVAAPVVGNQRVATGGIDDVVTGRTHRGLQIQESEFTGTCLYGEGTEGAAAVMAVGLRDDVDVLARRMQCQVGRGILTFGVAQNAESARGSIDFAAVHGGISAFGVVANVDVSSICHVLQLSCE